MVTVEGSLWKFCAVLIAACFCSKVVPSVGGDWGLVAAPVFIFANLVCSSLKPELLVATGGGDVVLLVSLFHGFDSPIPSPGTETPALPSRLAAPWLSQLFDCVDGCTGSCTGDGCDCGATASKAGGCAMGREEVDAFVDVSFRDGSRGGRLGRGLGAASEVPLLALCAILRCTGGGGR
jgi:hypothetical protein